MKTLCKINLLFSLFLFLIPNIYCQTDSQWYIKDGKMKIAPNRFENGAGNQIIINGFGEPNVSCNPDAKDDLFVIFDDHSYYNSRNTVEDYIYADEAIVLKGSENFLYLYSTNPYDIDPPERIISIETDLSETSLNNLTGSTATDIITANQDVVIGDDITLILNLSSLESDIYHLSTNSIVFSPMAILQAESDHIVDFSPIVINPGSFESSDIFNGSYHLSSNPDDITDVTIDENGVNFKFEKDGDNILYLNLRSANLDSFLLDHAYEEEINSTGILSPEDDPFNKVMFNLYKGDIRDEVIIDNLIEDIRHSHDPNYIKADLLCLDARKNKFVQYVCEFENVTKVPADNLRVEVKFPKEINVNKIKLLSAEANGDPLDLDGVLINTSIDSITSFTFNRETTIRKCELSIEESGTVKFRFCAGINGDISKEFNAYKISEAYTFFDYAEPIEKRYNLGFTDDICEKSPQAKLYELKCERKITDCDECAEPCLYWPYILASLLFISLLVFGFNKIKVKTKSKTTVEL